MGIRIVRRVVLVAAMLSSAGPVYAWRTLAEGDRGKLDVEVRLMLWAVSAGRDDLPAGTPPVPPQTESIQDFLVRRARLLLRARPSKSLEILLHVGQDSLGGKIARDDAGFRIKDLYLNYRKAEGLQVMVGQFKVPFLRHNLESGFMQLLVDRATIAGFRPAIEGQRDQGGMVWGNRGGFQYRAAIFDGSDQEDTNAASSLRGTARVSYNWFTAEPGTSYTGTTLGGQRILQVGLQADLQGDRLDGRDDAGFTTASRDYRAWAADLFLDAPFGDGWGITFEGAWLDRRDDYADPALATRTLDGFFAQAGLLLPGHAGPGRLQLAARYERFDVDRGSASTGTTNQTLGVGWFVKGHDRKLQLDYTDRRETPLDLDNDEIRLSLVAVY